MSEKPLSLIIPCHNSSKYLGECLDSVRAQSLGIENMNIILVDDASDDDGATLQILRDFEAEFPDSVRVLALPENLKQGGARNRALSYVDTEYLEFLDSDDTLHPDTCLTLLKVAHSEKAGLVLFNQPQIDSDFRVDLSTPEDRRLLLGSRLWTVNHSMKLYRSDLVLSHHLHFAENRFFEEPLFVYPAVFYADRLVFLKKEYYQVRVHDDSTMSGKAAEHLMDHPAVQKELLDFLKEQGLLTEYQDEIEEYILWTYFFETIINASMAPEKFSFSDICSMQDFCRSELPNWRNNPYVAGYPPAVLEILSGIELSISSEKALADYLKHSLELYHSIR